MPLDWTNFQPNEIPKSDETTVTNTDVSVPPDNESVIGLKPVPLGPGKVFKPGYPTSQTVRAAEEGTVTESPPQTYSYGDREFTIAGLWRGKVWAGYKIVSDLGTEELHVPISTSPEVLIRRHMHNKTGQVFISPAEVAERAVRLAMTTDLKLLDLHGVADSTRVHGILYPAENTVLASLADQNVFLISDSFKIVDAATNPWPIDLDKAKDVRSQLTAPVKYKDTIGLVASCSDDMVMVRGDKTYFVSIHDLEPIMLQRDYRLAMAGGLG